MEIRLSKETDVERIMEIIREAQKTMAARGIDQWQNGYPNADTIQTDLLQGISYVLIERGEIVATAAISFLLESTYEKIYEGQWLFEKPYVVVHRLAVDETGKGKGYAAILLKEAEKMCKQKGVTSFKIDTHKDNFPMQRLLEKQGFSYCGIIYLQEGSPRLAYEKRVEL